MPNPGEGGQNPEGGRFSTTEITGRDLEPNLLNLAVRYRILHSKC